MRSAVFSLFALLILTGPARAQRVSRLLPDGLAVGGSAGAVMAYGESVGVASFHAYQLKARGGGGAISLAVPPQVLTSGLLVMSDFGGAYNVAMPDATLLLKGGITGVVWVGDGAGGIPGLHTGATLIARLGGRVGLLIDVTQHWVWFGGEPAKALSIGIGLMALPPFRG